MASLGKTFDANAVAPREIMDALPPGEYHGHIIASEWKSTKDNAGRYLEFQIEVLSGPMNGRKMWDRLNLDNRSPQAVEIAERTLSAICHATNVMNVTDTDQLHFKPLVFKVGEQKSSTTSPPQMEVKGYKRFEGVTPAMQSQTAAQPRAAVAPAPRPTTPAYGGVAPAYGNKSAAVPPPSAPPSHAPGPWARQ